MHVSRRTVYRPTANGHAHAAARRRRTRFLALWPARYCSPLNRMPCHSTQLRVQMRVATRLMTWHTCVARRVIGYQLTHETIILGITCVTITWRAMLARPGPTSRPTNARCMASTTTGSVAAAGSSFSSQGRNLEIQRKLECNSSYLSCKLINPRLQCENLGDLREPKHEMLPCRKDVTPEGKKQRAPPHLRTERRQKR